MSQRFTTRHKSAIAVKIFERDSVKNSRIPFDFFRGVPSLGARKQAVPQKGGCSPLARIEPTLVRILVRVGFCFVPGRGCGSLTVWFRISNSTHDVEIRNDNEVSEI